MVRVSGVGRLKKTMKNQRKPPNTTRQAVLRLDSPSTPPLLKAEWTEADGGRGEERREREGREGKGQ